MIAGEFKMPDCEHTRPFVGTIVVTALTVPICSFCESDRMRAEIEQLRTELADARAFIADGGRI